jgi:hypothetical protein
MSTDQEFAETHYTVKIVAESPDGDKMPATITARVRINQNLEAQVVELSVMAPEGGALPTNAARSIDFDMLARSLSSAVAATVLSGTPAGTEEQPARRAKPDRPYRRMPDPELVAAELRRTGSVGQLARHFDVPRYTAQAWVDRLRRNGLLDFLDT